MVVGSSSSLNKLICQIFISKRLVSKIEGAGDRELFVLHQLLCFIRACILSPIHLSRRGNGFRARTNAITNSKSWSPSASSVSLSLSLCHISIRPRRENATYVWLKLYSDRGATLWWTDDRRHVPLDSWIARYRCSTKRRSHGRANNRRHRVYACALSSNPAGDRGTMRDPSYILTFWQMAGGSRALYFQTLVRRGGTRCVLETVSAFARKTDASHSFMEGLRKRGERKFYRDEYACTFY